LCAHGLPRPDLRVRSLDRGAIPRGSSVAPPCRTVGRRRDNLRARADRGNRRPRGHPSSCRGRALETSTRGRIIGVEIGLPRCRVQGLCPGRENNRAQHRVRREDACAHRDPTLRFRFDIGQSPRQKTACGPVRSALKARPGRWREIPPTHLVCSARRYSSGVAGTAF